MHRKYTTIHDVVERLDRIIELLENPPIEITRQEIKKPDINLESITTFKSNV